MTKHKTDAAAPAVTHANMPDKTKAAFDALHGALADLKPDALLKINFDIPTGASRVLGLAPRLQELLPVAKRLPDFKVEHLEHIDRYALAAWYTQIQCDGVTAPDLLKTLMTEALDLRGLLLGEADTLVRRKKLDAEKVTPLHAKSHGHVEVAQCLLELVALLRPLPSRGGVTDAELARAAALGPELSAAHGAQEAGQAVAPQAVDWADQRSRAFTLFVTAYNQCRRAAGYIRFDHGDADEWAPSLLGHGSHPSPAAPVTPPPAPPATT